MFLRASVFCLLGFGALGLLWFIPFAWVSQQDFERYQAIRREKEVATTSASLASSTSQTREGVRKDIWFADVSGTRLHYRIQSKSSELTLLPTKNDKVEIIENLHEIKCMMQDKLYFNLSTQVPMQQMRYLEAESGKYQYSTQQFIAQSVILSLYRLTGDLLPPDVDQKAAFLRGLAEDVSFSVSGKTPSFQAQHFKAFLKKSDL